MAIEEIEDLEANLGQLDQKIVRRLEVIQVLQKALESGEEGVDDVTPEELREMLALVMEQKRLLDVQRERFDKKKAEIKTLEMEIQKLRNGNHGLLKLFRLVHGLWVW